MSSKRAINMNLALSSTLLLLLLVGFASSNLNQDAAECTYKLIGISYCSPYVFDQANGAPSKDCCTGIKEIDHNGKRCLCLLFQDVRFNVLRALKLPGACKTPVNFTQCVGEYQSPLIYHPLFLFCAGAACLQFNQSLMICCCRCFAIGTSISRS